MLPTRRLLHQATRTSSFVSVSAKRQALATALPRFLTTALDIPLLHSSNHPYKPLPNANGSIIFTETDETPALATYSLLPVITKFCALADIDVVPCDVSLAGRILAAWPEKLKPEQRVPDNVKYLEELCNEPQTVIVKLPSCSATIPQLQACITELRDKGFDVPLYPAEPRNEEERAIQKTYSAILGSAVNPFLRKGNSDRRTAPLVKAHAKKYPHRMGEWSEESRTHVAHMEKGDFYESEQSAVMKESTDVVIELKCSKGTTKVLKESTPLEEGEVIDATRMSVKALCDFYEKEMEEARVSDLLLSLHLKPTAMKVSDPIMFGHCVRVFFNDAFEKHACVLKDIQANPNYGLSDVLDRVQRTLPEDQAVEILRDFDACYQDRPALAMVNGDGSITNLHVPSNTLIDASMSAVIRDSGKMRNKHNRLKDTKCLIPDRSYATMYQEVISFIKKNGQFDVATMGSVSTVGLMAARSEEMGSHDKTFEVPSDGTVIVRDKNTNEVYFEQQVEKGDVFRMCQTKEKAIRAWVHMAIERAQATGSRAIFWLDENRAHDKNLIDKVSLYLQDLEAGTLDVTIMRPVEACRITCKRAAEGKDTIAVTGNVLRDYLTDLFPVLEIGTSAKALSIVPLLGGGKVCEAGAGGTAPKHVVQFVQEGHLRWDPLGSYLAMVVALEHLGAATGNEKAKALAACLNKAVERILSNRKSPAREVNTIDNRGTNYYFALYWASFLAKQDPAFLPMYEKLSEARSLILDDLKESQGTPIDLGGYFKFDVEKAQAAMNPSTILNEILACH